MEIPRRIGGAAATSRPSLAAIGHNMDDVIVTCCFAAICYAVRKLTAYSSCRCQ